MIEGSGSGSGSIPLTNRSEPGGPRTYGSRSGFGSATLLERKIGGAMCKGEKRDGEKERWREREGEMRRRKGEERKKGGKEEG